MCFGNDKSLSIISCCLFEITLVHLYVEVDAELEGGAAQVLRPVHLVGQPSDGHVDAAQQKVPFAI